jgi:hypothetical protein
MASLRREFVRNAAGYFLTIAGLITMVIAHHISFDKLVETGAGLVCAGLYAFQHRTSPDAPATPKS